MELRNASKRERKAAEQEAKLLAKLKHPNIVSYKDSFETEEGYLYIAMGYCEGNANVQDCHMSFFLSINKQSKILRTITTERRW